MRNAYTEFSQCIYLNWLGISFKPFLNCTQIDYGTKAPRTMQKVKGNDSGNVRYTTHFYISEFGRHVFIVFQMIYRLSDWRQSDGKRIRTKIDDAKIWIGGHLFERMVYFPQHFPHGTGNVLWKLAKNDNAKRYTFLGHFGCISFDEWKRETDSAHSVAMRLER